MKLTDKPILWVEGESVASRTLIELPDLCAAEKNVQPDWNRMSFRRKQAKARTTHSVVSRATDLQPHKTGIR